jgi:hypothetical protein
MVQGWLGLPLFPWSLVPRLRADVKTHTHTFTLSCHTSLTGRRQAFLVQHLSAG